MIKSYSVNVYFYQLLSSCPTNIVPILVWIKKENDKSILPYWRGVSCTQSKYSRLLVHCQYHWLSISVSGNTVTESLTVDNAVAKSLVGSVRKNHALDVVSLTLIQRSRITARIHESHTTHSSPVRRGPDVNYCLSKVYERKKKTHKLKVEHRGDAHYVLKYFKHRLVTDTI